MTTSELWKSLGSLAEVWRKSPAFDRFIRDLPRNSPQRSQGLPGILQKMQAGVPALVSNPLILASRLPMAMSVMPGANMQQLRTEYGDWLESVERIESAHRQTVAWFRSRLPGYPNLPAPQLAPGTEFTTQEFTRRITWQPGERASQLQLQDVPNGIVSALLVDWNVARGLTQSTRDVAAALMRTSEWTVFAAVTDMLDETARADLRAARARTRGRLLPDAVDAYEPSLAVHRGSYRVHVLQDEIGSLNGTARAYADAFGAVDDLVNDATSNIFGQIACYPIQTIMAEDLEVTPGVPTSVRFTTPDNMPDLPEPGVVAWVDDPLIVDAIQLKEMTLHFEQTGQSALKLTAETLPGTAAAWRGQRA